MLSREQHPINPNQANLMWFECELKKYKKKNKIANKRWFVMRNFISPERRLYTDEF